MKVTRTRRSISLFISIAVFFAMLTVLPCASKRVEAAKAEPSLVCFMEIKSNGDPDNLNASVTIKNCKPGDVVTATFVLTYDELYFSDFSNGIELVKYNNSTLDLTLKITGKTDNPNGTYTFTISGSNIGDMAGKPVALKGTTVTNTKPGPGDGPGDGPGADGPGGGPGSDGPGGGPGAKPTQVEKDTPTPTPVPTSTPTPVPTSTPTPVPTCTPTPVPTATPTPVPTSTPTPVPTSTPTPVPTISPTPEVTETTTETTEESITEETATETTEATVAAPVVPETDETDPSGSEPTEESTAPSTTEEKKVTRAAKASSSDSNSYILLGILAILVILAYLRYSRLSKKDMSFPDICKNFIPVGAVVNKVKERKKSKDTTLDGPQPEVMNGYLQKPTVGLAAAKAIRPVRSNVSRVKATDTESAEKPQTASPKPVQRPGNAARASKSNADPALLEMERRQKIMEKEMNELFSKKEKLPGDDIPKTE